MNSAEPTPVIGLEIHCQLDTRTRLFSAGPVDYDAAQNHRVTDYDLGMPGTLPVVNRRAVDMALAAGIALGCTIHSTSRFDRKHYFYPDLPKGYQITQYHRPICTGGELEFDVGDRTRRIAISRLHLEEDAAKSIHDPEGRCTLVDFNRAGVPLIEIVTEPQLHTPRQAERAMRALHRLVVHLGICDGNLQEGSFRCDANLSLIGPDGGGSKRWQSHRVELKNLNSFRFVRRALSAEIERLQRLWNSGEERVDETRSYDPDTDRTVSMRTKETSPDYRYVADPDLPAIHVDYHRLERIREQLAELPRIRRRRFVEQFGLSREDADTLVDPPGRAAFFERAVGCHPDNPQGVANFIIHELLAYRPEGGIAKLEVSPEDIGRIVELTDEKTISSSGATRLLEELLRSNESPGEVVQRLGLRQLGDRDHIAQIVEQVLDEHPELVEDYRRGKTKLFGHFMGRIMDASDGRVDPGKAAGVLREKLSRSD